MNVSKRFKILIVDKKSKYPYLFNGLRKKKFSISICNSVLNYKKEDLNNNFNMFFVVLYESRDLIQLVKLFDVSKSIIVASQSRVILNSFEKMALLPLVDLSKDKFTLDLQTIINEFYDKFNNDYSIYSKLRLFKI
jgi:hypothetical protein